MTKHIAILGGTFDPVHIGHLRMAIELRLAGFDEVRLIPNNVPPHREQPKASAEHRLAMRASIFRNQESWLTISN